jgi:WhiB family redox-sensing transcriptional regulator
MAIAEIWNEQAACRGLDPEIFYPVSEEEAEHAKAVCGQCAVQQACLEHALGSRERDGVWGGATEKERRRIIRQRRRSS